VSRNDKNVWALLKTEKPTGQNLWARRCYPDISERLIAALDSEGRRHYLILLGENDSGFKDTQTRGISVETRDLMMPRHADGRYMDIICHDTAGHEAFDLIGGEIANKLATEGENVCEIVSCVIAKWRRFWGQLPKQMLSREQQIGLFSEIWFLYVWVIPKIGVEYAISGWRGPAKSRHDFEWPGLSIEVKGTTSIRGRIHSIHGLEQLTYPETGRLLFFSLRMREEAGANNSLPTLISECRKRLEKAPDYLSLFEHALAKAGYSAAYNDEYSLIRYRVVDEALFRVEENFPKIDKNSFYKGIPPGIEKVDYEINLISSENLIIAKNAAAMPDLTKHFLKT